MTPPDDHASLFRKSWTLYDALTAENYMFHRELYAGVAEILEKRRATGPYKMLDLGCGNARFLAPCLRRVPAARYDGVDLSAAALAEGVSYLAGMENVFLHEGDMVDFAETTPHRYDLIFTGYAVHHLKLEQKERLLRACARAVTPGGEIVMIDVLREDGQDRDSYLANYLRLMREEWTAISGAMIEEACAHVAAHDDPASYSELCAVAAKTGWPRVEVIDRHGPHHLLRIFR